MRTPDLRWPRIAVVGSGISGLVAAHGLKDHAQVTLFEDRKSTRLNSSH